MNRLIKGYELPGPKLRSLDSILLNFTHYTMSLAQTLKELEQSFKPYESMWEDWRLANQHNLTPLELYALDKHRNNNFKSEKTSLRLIYNRLSVIQKITKKLGTDYKYFKEWTVRKFQTELVQLLQKTNWKRFYKTPITLLPIDQALKDNLAFYKVKTLNELFDKYLDKDFEYERRFKQVLKFLQLKKELITI